MSSPRAASRLSLALKAARTFLCWLLASGTWTACGGEGGADDDERGGSVRQSTCEDLDGDGRGPGCQEGVTDCAPNDPRVFPGAVDLCGNGLDEDCDNVVDETCACVPGATRHCVPDGPVCRPGVERCVAGTWSACEGAVPPARAEEALCDGEDEDCDGIADEGVTNACGACGEVPAEECGDLLDNDCDGAFDEPEAGCACRDGDAFACYSGPPQTLGVGRCVGGYATCVRGAWDRCIGELVPDLEICNGADDDCDGRVDEGLANACGGCDGPEPEELCNYADDDCDGAVDEGLRLACGTCPQDRREEQCGNGFDDDCDGFVDEGCGCVTGAACYPGVALDAGVGACAFGQLDCADPERPLCVGAVLPSAEVCDGVDNDCDGSVDALADGCTVCDRGEELCDGVDNDCDGSVDEGVRDACGLCEGENPLEAEELCDGIDEDCDGLVDEQLLNDCGTCAKDCFARETTGEGWRVGERTGLDDERIDEGLRLAEGAVSFSDLWVANTSDQTVTRIDTESQTVLGTYPVGASPSRTAVDLDGNVWVANRAFGAQGSVTKVLREGCEGDACVAFTVDVGGVDDVPRGLAVDAENFVWVGTHTARELHRLDATTGEVVEVLPAPLAIYGLAIDATGWIWMTSLGGAIAYVDPQSGRSGGPWTSGACSGGYGIAVDRSGDVWTASFGCGGINRLVRSSLELRGEAEIRHYELEGAASTRGLAIDGLGFVYVADSGVNRVFQFDPRVADRIDAGETVDELGVRLNATQWSTPVCRAPIGVGIAADGNIWAGCNGSDEAQVVAPDGVPGRSLGVGRNPYSYSDMTGFQLRNVTAPTGVWTGVVDCGRDDCIWQQATREASLPGETAVRMRARSATRIDAPDWSVWTPSTSAEQVALAGRVPDGRYLEVEIQLVSDREANSPIVGSMSVEWLRP